MLYYLLYIQYNIIYTYIFKLKFNCRRRFFIFFIYSWRRFSILLDLKPCLYHFKIIFYN